jgi:hypothetical protein
MCPTSAFADEHPQLAERATLSDMVAGFTRCVAGKHHQEAKDYVLSSELRDIRNDPALFDKQCLLEFDGNVQVSFVSDLYRDDLATALVQTDFAEGGPATFDKRAPLVQPPTPNWADLVRELGASPSPSKLARQRAVFVRGAERADLSRISECMVRAEPVATRRWVLDNARKTGSPSTDTAVASAFTRCSEGASIVHFFN